MGEMGELMWCSLILKACLLPWDDVNLHRAWWCGSCWAGSDLEEPLSAFSGCSSM